MATTNAYQRQRLPLLSLMSLFSDYSSWLDSFFYIRAAFVLFVLKLDQKDLTRWAETLVRFRLVILLLMMASLNFGNVVF